MPLTKQERIDIIFLAVSGTPRQVTTTFNATHDTFARHTQMAVMVILILDWKLVASKTRQEPIDAEPQLMKGHQRWSLGLWCRVQQKVPSVYPWRQASVNAARSAFCGDKVRGVAHPRERIVYACQTSLKVLHDAIRDWRDRVFKHLCFHGAISLLRKSLHSSYHPIRSKQLSTFLWYTTHHLARVARDVWTQLSYIIAVLNLSPFGESKSA